MLTEPSVAEWIKPTPQMLDFAPRLTAWQRLHGRHNLPWQVTDPYKIWLSEIMLQQTQVTTVLGYYARFLERFPTVGVLAHASIHDVLALWSGLGYYHRARYLHQTAQKIVTDYSGIFPRHRDILQTLPGVGRSTAAAIAVFAFGQREAILDGNVKRVLARVFGITLRDTQPLWVLANALLPLHKSDMIAYTQGLMDLGATLCIRSNPLCALCPMQTICTAAQLGKTADFPSKKPKITLPIRHIILLLAQHKNKLYLERRPITGIWGGMLAFPECATHELATQRLAKLGQGALLPTGTPFKHTLTHVHLMITPQPACITRRNPLQSDTAGQWLQPEKALQEAIPKPIRQLLLQSHLIH